jgi:hypothetical protein
MPEVFLDIALLLFSFFCTQTSKEGIGHHKTSGGNYDAAPA